jgi:superfamily II DNA or RNA helicase
MELLAESGAAPKSELLDFETRPFAGPLTPLQLLSEPSAIRYTSAVLRRADDLEPWIFSHTSQTRYPEMPFDNPVVYMLRSRGVFSTQLGPKKATEAVGPGLSEFASILPVAEDVDPDRAGILGLPNSIDELGKEHWQTAFDQVLQADDDGVIGQFYAAAATLEIPTPEELRCRAGSVHASRPREAITVSDDADLLSVLAKTGEPYIRVATAEERDLLVERWGLLDAGATVRSEVTSTSSGEPEALADRFPMLRPRLSDEQRALLLQPCSEIRIERFTEHGRVGDPTELAVAGDTVYHLGDLDDPRLLRLLDAKLSLGLDEAQIVAVLRNREARRVRDLRTKIRKAPDDQDRLLLAIGVEELRAHLPSATLDAVSAFEGELDDRGLAGLALIVHGPRVLQEHEDALEQAGLEPPSRWAGGRNAVAFVRDLGFGAEFAGFESRGYDRQEEVDGPPELGDLHDFQRIVVREMRETLRNEVGNRGLLSLPTGAGKTRVTIEAIVDAIADGELESPILWVAQTEELCEQAIEAWSELWRGKGPRERLTISRLRADFEAEEAEYGHQVVVATIAKLDATNGVFTKPSYDWLRGASCIVVDEAHRSVGTSYRRLLDWQGIGTNRVRDKPLLGLTATPFRGTNEAETKRLVARYGNRRLDLNALGGADAYPELQRIGILSEVDHDLLDGIEIELTAAELKEMKSSRLRQLPDAALRKLAADVNRNRTLVDHIGEQPDDWPILLFAVSVNHAHTMAALLNRTGISAAAISSDTDKGARRHYIERFRRNKIRVLANYDVLTAGFDAPSVRAVYIARPVYAPNTYQQMIGRGLRGPKNGGTERCLLVNLEDNVLRFEETLAFHEFEYLWAPETAVAT